MLVAAAVNEEAASGGGATAGSSAGKCRVPFVFRHVVSECQCERQRVLASCPW